MTDKEIVTFAGPHFSRRELECRCGCGALPKTTLMIDLRKARELLGPLVIKSCARCLEHDNKVGHTTQHHPHVDGLAVDIRCFGELAGELDNFFKSLGYTGFGYSQKGDIDRRFIHFDKCPWRSFLTIWSY